MKLALLINPAARAGTQTGLATRAVERLRDHGIHPSIITGRSAHESSQLLRAAIDRGVDAVAVAGGDGTVNLAANQLAGTSIPLGVIPTGNGNDFAAMLGLHELDPLAAADTIAAGATRTFDLARVTREDGSNLSFATVLASGFDSRVNDRANAMRRPRGRSRYNLAILIEFLALAPIAYDVMWEAEDGTRGHFHGDLLMATVGNTRTYGGGIPICPDADPTDGLLDLILVRPAGRLELLRLLRRVYAGTHTESPRVSGQRVRWVRLTAPQITAYADGDPLGALPVEITADRNALIAFAPKD